MSESPPYTKCSNCGHAKLDHTMDAFNCQIMHKNYVTGRSRQCECKRFAGPAPATPDSTEAGQ